jgi:glycosyltransferase involved in cell wall biosynthesis
MGSTRTALCHEWVTSFGGAEQVSQQIAAALDIKDIYTFAAEPGTANQLFPDQRVRVHPLGRTTVAQKHWQWMLPVMPAAWRNLNLGSYGIVLTNSYACTNAIEVAPGSYHISYCQTPMRYAWEWRRELGRFPSFVRPLWPAAAAVFRRADRRWAQRVTLFIANSHNVADRIRRYYGRGAVVAYPSIDTTFWTPSRERPRGDYFLMAGRMVSYKQIDVGIAAAEKAGVRMIVAGSGPEFPRLQQRAGRNIEFILRPTTDELRELYRSARAFVFPGIEDFGITMVEAQSCGTPVIALNAGGARETVKNGVTGILYEPSSPAALSGVLRTFDPDRFSESDLREHVGRFDVRVFRKEIRRIVAATTGVSVREASTDDFARRLQQDLDLERE